MRIGVVLASAALALCASADAQEPVPEAAAARAAPSSMLRLTLHGCNGKGETVPLRDTAVHLSRVDPDPATNAKGTLTLRLPAGDYSLDVVAARRCHHVFTLGRKDMSLDLLVPDDGGSCKPYVAGQASAAASRPASAAAGGD